MPEIASFPEQILTINFSAEDIVAHCHRVSYIQHNVKNDGDVTRNQGATATLTMAAQPSANPVQTPAISTQPTFVSAQPAIAFTQPASQTYQLPSSPPVQFDFAGMEPQAEQDEQDDHDLFLGNVTQGAMNHNNDGATGASGVVRQTVHNLSAQQYPFMDEFDPYSTSTLDFDLFNMNQDAAFASISASTYLAPANSEFPETFNIDDLLSSDLFDMTNERRARNAHRRRIGMLILGNGEEKRQRSGDTSNEGSAAF